MTIFTWNTIRSGFFHIISKKRDINIKLFKAQFYVSVVLVGRFLSVIHCLYSRIKKHRYPRRRNIIYVPNAVTTLEYQFEYYNVHKESCRLVLQPYSQFDKYEINLKSSLIFIISRELYKAILPIIETLLLDGATK